jgi:hypothetical protein
VTCQKTAAAEAARQQHKRSAREHGDDQLSGLPQGARCEKSLKRAFTDRVHAETAASKNIPNAQA